jgi:hypothetical protein
MGPRRYAALFLFRRDPTILPPRSAASYCRADRARHAPRVARRDAERSRAGGLRARVHRSAGEERPCGEATNARTWGPAAFPERLGGPASRRRMRVAGTIPCVQAFVELLAKFAPPENARHELGSSHSRDRKRRRGAKVGAPFILTMTNQCLTSDSRREKLRLHWTKSKEP